MPEDTSPVVLLPEEKLSAQAQADRKELVRGNNEFAFDLYARLRKKEGNLVFSPYSISSALAMTYAGARGKTAEEMAKVLRFHLPDARLHSAFSTLTTRLQVQQKSGSPKVVITNALWGQEGLPFDDEFLQLTREEYKGGLRTVNFKSDAQAARRTINRAIADQTRGLIPELLSPTDVDARTRLALINAVYFLGDWLAPFEKENTVEMPFYRTGTDHIKVPMMRGTPADWYYLEGPDFQLVELPYRGRDLVAVFLLPKKVDGLPQFEASVNADRIREWCSRARGGRLIAVNLPKFRLAKEYRLADELKDLGMSTAFKDEADFSGICPDRLGISAVIHQTKFNLDEKGTEAAAATAVVFDQPLSMPAPEIPISFHVDKPFLFLVRDRNSGAVLFLGRVVDPNRP